ALNEGEALALDYILRNRLSVVTGESRLVIEQVQLRGGARHKQKDDPLRLGREVESLRQWSLGGLRKQPIVQQRRERQGSDAEAPVLEKLAPRLPQQLVALHSY